MTTIAGTVTVLQECGSTNTEAADRGRYRHGDAVVAVRQTDGRGQRGHRWESAAGENLTFSVVLEPRFVPVARQFLVSEAAALAVADTLGRYGIDAGIKWTNDIYVGDSKICGMLIEHSVEGNVLARSIVGVGLNVNQTSFPEWLPNPCSMAAITGLRYDVMEVFRRFYDNLASRYGMLEDGAAERLHAEYNRLLYRRGVPSRYLIPSHGEVVGTITGVEPDGTLLVAIDGTVSGFRFKEIEFII